MSSPATRTASEIARETIKQLASRRITPTPDNYAEIYLEIAGGGDGAAGHAALRLLEQTAATLARVRADDRNALAFERNVRTRSLDQAGTVLGALLNTAPAPADQTDWADLIRELLRQWEARHPGVTPARKRETIEHVLTGFGADPVKLATRLRATMRAWGEGGAGATETVPPGAVPALPANVVPLSPLDHAADGADPAAALRQLLAQTLRHTVAERLGFNPKLSAEAAALAERAAAAGSVREIGALEKALRAFWLRLEFSGESQAELIRGLQRLLELMINNVGELVDDDAWVQGQVAELRNLVAAPLTARGLRDAERSLRGVIYKQALIKHSLDQTKSALKSMLTTFVERLAAIAAATGGYNERLGRYTRELESVRDVTALEGIVTAVVADARALQANIVRTRDELEEARIRVAEYESRIAGMRAELVALSAAVKEDVLTRALNRRGLEEAFAVEAARCDRSGAPLALALLDIDNFKALNDRLGHAVGDTALQHLADAVREALRPTDILARYGGEEFVVLLPGASLNEGREVMIRVQRALTRRYFMANNERVLVTFSAGVAVRRANESESVSIERADRALLRAKAEGKNRVATDADDGT